MADEDLLTRIAAGDRDAFGQFYDRHAATVLGVVHRWVDSRSDAEEVLQDAFWQVWRQASRYDPQRASARGWLFLIVRSRAIDALRRRQRAYSGDAGGPVAALDDPLAEIDEPLALLERHESNQRLANALEILPEEQRTALQLAFYAGLTYEQVAAHQAIPLGTAKTRIRAALRRLRTQLAEPRDELP